MLSLRTTLYNKQPDLCDKRHDLQITRTGTVNLSSGYVRSASSRWVCGLSLVGIASSDPAGGMDVCVVIV